MGKRRFAGTISPNSYTDVSRYDSLLSGHIRGWDCGVKVNTYVDAENRDCFEIWVTGGSNDDSSKRMIGTLVEGVGFLYSPAE